MSQSRCEKPRCFSLLRSKGWISLFMSRTAYVGITNAMCHCSYVKTCIHVTNYMHSCHNVTSCIPAHSSHTLNTFKSPTACIQVTHCIHSCYQLHLRTSSTLYTNSIHQLYTPTVYIRATNFFRHHISACVCVFECKC